MSANPDSPTPFQLSVPPTVRQCEDTVLSWSGGNTTPLFEVYYAEGPGETGDESTLGEEKLLGSSGGNNFTWTIDPSWNTKIGDVVRFRVADNNGQGQNATSWAKIAAGNVDCNINEAPLLDSEDSFISSISQTSETTTSSSLVAQSIPSGTSVSSSQSAVNPPQVTSSSSSSIAAPVPVPTSTSSPVNDPPTFIEEPSTDGSTDPVDESPQNSDDQGSNNSAAPSLETVVQDGTTLVFGGADPVTTQTARGSTPSISPEVTAAQDSKDGTAKGKLPASAVGAIVGSLICAIILSALFIIWLRKRRKARAFHPMHEEEEPSHRSSHPSTSSSYSSTGMRGAVKTLLTVPTSLVSSPPHNPFKSNKPSPLPLIIEPAGRRSLSPSPMADRDSGSYSQFLATPDAYTAMGDTFSALNSPDPFRRSFGARPVATAL